jgi:crossover junction endodeoxyribonuclease RuvC
MRVLGLDPGLTCAGYGIVSERAGRLKLVEYGTIRTPREEIQHRLAALFEAVLALIERTEPEAVAVERVLFNANARTAMSVGQAAGIALLAAAKGGCEVAQYNPSEVKMAVAGYGRADKAQVQTMIARLLGLAAPPKPPDAADALALAVTHIHARRLRALAREAISTA